MAFFFSMRRVSLLEMNQRLLRMVLNTPLLTTFLRKRLSKESCDSPLRKCTEPNEITYFLLKNEQKKRPSKGSAGASQIRPETN